MESSLEVIIATRHYGIGALQLIIYNILLLLPQIWWD